MRQFKLGMFAVLLLSVPAFAQTEETPPEKTDDFFQKLQSIKVNQVELETVIPFVRFAGEHVAQTWLWGPPRSTGWLLNEYILPFCRIQELSERKDYEGIIADSNRMLRLFPQSASIYFNRAGAWHLKGNDNLAIADLNAAIQLDPNHGKAFAHRAQIWSEKRDFDRAIADFSEAIRLTPDYVRALNGRAWAYYSKREFDLTIADANAVIRIDPINASAFNNRGLGWWGKQKTAEAMAAFNEAIRINPKFNYALTNRAGIYIQTRQYSEALDDLNEAIRSDPSHANAFYNRGCVYGLKKDFERAIQDFRESIRLSPNEARTHGILAQLLANSPDEKLRDAHLAVTHAEKACALTDWKSAKWIETLANAYLELGDIDEAIKWQTKALEVCAEEYRADYQKTLEHYQAEKRSRERAVKKAPIRVIPD